MPLCPCCSQTSYEQCCQPYLDGQKTPQTPEQLMRSRYTAYSQANIDYIKKTMTGKPLIHFNDEEAKKWAKQSQWLNLKVIESTTEQPELGFVEFIATFIDHDRLTTIHERSEFHKKNNHWFYVDGINQQETNIKNPKITRNSTCPCGSGKKYKNCHQH